MPSNVIQMHASCIAVGDKGVLLLGNSGSGKSDIVLRALDRGHRLVCDDRVDISYVDNALVASPPKNIVGKLEVRGVGIITAEYIPEITLSYVVQLVRMADIERFPEVSSFVILGVSLPLYSLYPFEESALIKLECLISNKVL